MSNALRRAVRTLVQLVAAGGLTGIVNAIAGGLSAQAAAVVLAASTFVATWAQNALESHGLIPTMLPPRADELSRVWRRP